MSADPIMAEIMGAIRVLQNGDRVGGRAQLGAIWTRIAADPQPFHECMLSHYLADAEDDLSDELAWDLRALDAARRCTDDDARRNQALVTIAAFMPSLHLNLGEDYLKLGDLAHSRAHLVTAQGLLGDLDDDAYGELIRRGAERLARQLAAASEGGGD